jgi:hypothetical protein
MRVCSESSENKIIGRNIEHSETRQRPILESVLTYYPGTLCIGKAKSCMPDLQQHFTECLPSYILCSVFGKATPVTEPVELSVRHIWFGVWNPIRHLNLLLLREVKPIVLRLAGQVSADKRRQMCHRLEKNATVRKGNQFEGRYINECEKWV